MRAFVLCEDGSERASSADLYMNRDSRLRGCLNGGSWLEVEQCKPSEMVNSPMHCVECIMYIWVLKFAIGTKSMDGVCDRTPCLGCEMLSWPKLGIIYQGWLMIVPGWWARLSKPEMESMACEGYHRRHIACVWGMLANWWLILIVQNSLVARPTTDTDDIWYLVWGCSTLGLVREELYWTRWNCGTQDGRYQRQCDHRCLLMFATKLSVFLSKATICTKLSVSEGRYQPDDRYKAIRPLGCKCYRPCVDIHMREAA